MIGLHARLSHCGSAMLRSREYRVGPQFLSPTRFAGYKLGDGVIGSGPPRWWRRELSFKLATRIDDPGTSEDIRMEQHEILCRLGCLAAANVGLYRR
jgi:hypothetical protein